MTENTTAEQFRQDVDRILREVGGADGAVTEPDYRRDLTLAAELAVTDWSNESRTRASLRRQLLNREPAKDVWRRHTRLVALAASVAVLAIVLLIQPGLRAAVITPALAYLERLVLGERNEAVLVERPADGELAEILARRAQELESGQSWSLRTAVSTIGGDVPSGREPVIRTYNSLKLAESAALFRPRKPGYLPEGYGFDSASLTPSDDLVIWYRAPGKRITLQQKPLQPGSATVHMSMGAGGSLDKVDLAGRSAAWINGQKLTWQTEELQFVLEGNDLSLDGARRIALSLE